MLAFLSELCKFAKSMFTFALFCIFFLKKRSVMNCHLTPGSLSEPPAGNAVSRYGLLSLFPNDGNACGLKFNINIYTNNYKQIVTGFCVLAVGKCSKFFFQ